MRRSPRSSGQYSRRKEAIRSFAGAKLENAVVEPAAQAALVVYDSTVTHHTVVVDTVGANARTSR